MSVSASRYLINVLARNGLVLRFGRFTFAAPSSKIAIAQTGEGIQIDAGPFLGNFGLTLSHIVRPLRNPDLEPSHDNAATLLQFSMPLHSTNAALDKAGPEKDADRDSFWRTANVYLLQGRDQDAADPHSYSTAGAEIFFARPQTKGFGYVAGSGSFYHSWRGRGDTRDGHGNVGLLRASWSPQITAAETKSTATDTVTLLFGMGTSDNSSKPSDESYVSENQAFSPDLIFFNALTGPLREGNIPGVGYGLGGKHYAQIQYTTTRWSLLRSIAARVVGPTEVISWGTTISLESIRLGNPRNGSRIAGTELDVRSVVETPRNAKLTLSAGWYRAGRALSDITRNYIYTVSLGVNIEP